MKKFILNITVALVASVLMPSCRHQTKDVVSEEKKDEVKIDSMCPELISIENEIKSKVPFMLPGGNLEVINASYEDTVFTLYYQVDCEIISESDLQKEQKDATLATIQASAGKARESYKKYVEYRVTKVDVYTDKRTKKTATIKIAPSEIDEALKKSPSAKERLKELVDMLNEMLPHEMGDGFVSENVEMKGGLVIVNISVDEDIYNLNKLFEIKDGLKESVVDLLLSEPIWKLLCQHLRDVHYGLEFRYYGNQTFQEVIIQLDAEEIVSLS